MVKTSIFPNCLASIASPISFQTALTFKMRPSAPSSEPKLA